MTNLNDFDRSLADFLADGPNTAPEAPVIAALAHARTTPRRPDPLLRLRSDVMARPRVGAVGQRPGLVFAALALALTSVGIAMIGSRPNDLSVGPGPTPSAPRGTLPAATMPAPFRVEIPLTLSGGSPFTLTVVDDTGVLAGAESGQPVGDGASVDGVAITAVPDDPRALLVTWVGLPCETAATLTVDGRQRTLSIVSQRCSGDTFPYDRVVRLGFSNSVRPGEWSATNVLAPEATDPGVGPGESATTGGPFEPIGSPAVTPVRVVLDDGVGDETTVDVVDESGRLVSAVAGPQTGGNGIEAFDASNDDPTTLRLSWPGRPCDTVHRLTIDPTLTSLTMDLPQCRGDLVGVDRSIVLTFRDAVDAHGLNTALFAGRGGVDMPTWTMIAPDSGAGTYRVRLRDPGYVVQSLDGYFDPERGATGVPDAGYAFDQIDGLNLRLVWLGPSCATAFDLVLDPTGDTWTLWSAPCETSVAVLRMFDIELARPLTATAVKFEARVGEPRG